MKALLYCIESKPYLLKDVENNNQIFIGIHNYGSVEKHSADTELGMNLEYERLCCKTLNGSVVAECDYDIEGIKFNHIHERDDLGRLHNEWWWEYRGLNIGNYQCALAKESCLDSDDIMDYLVNKDGYAIHISNLDVYAEPKKIDNYVKGEWVEYSYGPVLFIPEIIESAPKNMTFIWSNDNGHQYLFIPVNPEQLCKILNKECTIIIKKRVPKELR